MTVPSGRITAMATVAWLSSIRMKSADRMTAIVQAVTAATLADRGLPSMAEIRRRNAPR
jgi:hypothetical protein